MAPTIPPTPNSASSSNDFPLAGIIAICVGGYLLVVSIIMLTRHLMKSKGMTCCAGATCCSSISCVNCTNEEGSNACLQSCAESCNCQVPTKTQCLDCACPTKQWCDEKCCCCMSAEPNGECCPDIKGPECGCGDCCDCRCQCNTPDSINCICFEIKTR